MEIKISELDLSFIIPCLESTNVDLLTQLRGRHTASVFSINTDTATKLHSWLKEQFRLMDCGEKYDTAEAKEILRDINTCTKWHKSQMKKKNVRTFKFSRIQIKFLKTHLQNSELHLFQGLQNSIVASCFNFDDEFATGLHDWASEQLQFLGFDEDYNLTRAGRVLENIIDLLNRCCSF